MSSSNAILACPRLQDPIPLESTAAALQGMFGRVSFFLRTSSSTRLGLYAQNLAELTEVFEKPFNQTNINGVMLAITRDALKNLAYSFIRVTIPADRMPQLIKKTHTSATKFVVEFPR